MNTHDTCSLPSSTQSERLKVIRAELKQARTQYIAPGERRYTFAPDIVRAQRLEALVEAERKCCGFMQFELQTEGEISLSIKGPEKVLGQLEMGMQTETEMEGNKKAWGVALAGVLAVATCTLPVALGAAALWIEGGGFVLLGAAAVMIGWRIVKTRRRVKVA